MKQVKKYINKIITELSISCWHSVTGKKETLLFEVVKYSYKILRFS